MFDVNTIVLFYILLLCNNYNELVGLIPYSNLHPHHPLLSRLLSPYLFIFIRKTLSNSS